MQVGLNLKLPDSIGIPYYNKHYVSGPGQVDYQKFYGQADLNTFLKGAETALNAMKRDPRVDPRRIFVYGWSEGSSVAAQLVRDHPEFCVTESRHWATSPGRAASDFARQAGHGVRPSSSVMLRA
ncbi:alpha/beta hydrolase [Deinococcus wulumuqiensis R12]|uniref:alpha/beta hydrolase family protein n=2 Tax=Deinococcus wulumuqiensis TaxID=980427 RepID=UPI000368F927|nr:alpha/beta hydrolase [Deinococcus wulumuqiensis]QII19614.1 alpha/beta hydrolase [Deinococcus wulumuqiensis R12]